MKRVLGAVLLLAGLFVVGWLSMTRLLIRSENARREQELAVVSLGASLGSSVDEIPLGTSLKQSCAGKLQSGTQRSIVVYSLPIEAAFRPNLDGKRVDGVLASWSHSYVGVAPADPFQPGTEWSRMFSRASEFYEWPDRLEDLAKFDEDTAALRYVVAARFSYLTAPSLPFSDTGSFDPGSATYRAKVVSFPDGKVICEGSGDARMVEKVIGHGVGRYDFDAQSDARHQAERKLQEKWVDATVGSVIEDVCQAGGDKLCYSAGLMTNGPDW